MTRYIVLQVIFLFLFVSPVVVMLFYAFSSTWAYPDIIPDSFDLRSVSFLFTHKVDIVISLIMSTLYSFGAVGVTIALTVWPAKIFARMNFTGKYLLEGLFLSPALVPPMAFAMGAHYMFISIGIADTVAGVILILSLFSYPYMLRALTAGYQAMGEDYEMCAENIGAGKLRILLSIEMPLLLPAVISGGIIVFLVAFSEYFLVFLIGGGVVPSYSGYIFPLLNSSDKSVASLLTLVFLVVPVILFVFIDRFLLSFYRRRGVM